MARRIFIGMIAGGLTGLAIVLIYILVRAQLDDAKPGDWLQFCGALLGSGTAVGGALLIESRKRNRDERRGKVTLLDALGETAHAIRSAGEALEGDLNKKVAEINARRYLLEVAKEFLDFVLKQHLSPDSKVWRNSRGFANYIDRILSVDWFAHDPNANDDLCSDETVEHWEKAVTKICGSILPILDGEIEKLKNNSQT